MPDIQQNVSTVFTVIDQASKPLQAMAGQATRLTGMFDRASGMLGNLGVLAGAAAGAFSLHHIITGTVNFLGNVKRIQDYTGMTADSAGGLLDVMTGVGIEGNEAVRAFQRMSMSGARMGMHVRGMYGGLAGVRNMYTQLGMAGKTPEQQLMRMAELAKKNQIGVSQVQMMYRLMPESARKLMSVLKKGPEHIKEEVEAFKKLGIATQENVDRVFKIRNLQYRVKGLWENIQMIIGVQLLPVIVDLMEKMATKLEGWIEHAKTFGQILGSFLKNHLSTVVSISKVLMLNFTLMKATGMGLGGFAGKLGGVVKTTVLGGIAPRAVGAAAMLSPTRLIGALLPSMAKVGHTLALPSLAAGKVLMEGPALLKRTFMAARMAFAISPRAAITTIVGDLFKGIGRGGMGVLGLVGRLVRSFGMLRPVIMMATRLALVSGILIFAFAFIIKAVEIIRGNVDGILTYIGEWWLTIKARLAVIFDMFTMTFGDSTPLGQFLHKFVFGAIVMALDMVDGMLLMVQTIILMITRLPTNLSRALTDTVGYFEENMRMAQYMTKERQRKMETQDIAEEIARKRKTATEPTERAPSPYNDFRGSRFTIDQHFAEGFDPDRIAVAFTNDLSVLGERRLQTAGYGMVR